MFLKVKRAYSCHSVLVCIGVINNLCTLQASFFVWHLFSSNYEKLLTHKGFPIPGSTGWSWSHSFFRSFKLTTWSLPVVLYQEGFLHEKSHHVCYFSASRVLFSTYIFGLMLETNEIKYLGKKKSFSSCFILCFLFGRERYFSGLNISLLFRFDLKYYKTEIERSWAA